MRTYLRMQGRVMIVLLWACVSPFTITMALWQDNWQDIKEGYRDAFNYPFKRGKR